MTLTNSHYTLSARGKGQYEALIAFLDHYYSKIDRNEVDSVFGFVEQSTLYGGRTFVEPELTDEDVQRLYEMNIGLRLPLTNKYVSAKDYETNQAMLQKYHRQGNAVIVVKDELAKWIRRDFPLYSIEASTIKNINSYRKIDKALALYDSVVLPASLNDDIAFLEKVEYKAPITLFANAGCAYNCPSKICYNYISKQNKFTGAKYHCSKKLIPRKELGVVDFDLDVFRQLGYRRFKVLRSRGVTGY